jgi:hypothetical protein
MGELQLNSRGFDMFVRIKIDCLGLDGNTSYMSGLISHTSNPVEGELGELNRAIVRDNGEGHGVIDQVSHPGESGQRRSAELSRRVRGPLPAQRCPAEERPSQRRLVLDSARGLHARARATIGSKCSKSPGTAPSRRQGLRGTSPLLLHRRSTARDLALSALLLSRGSGSVLRIEVPEVLGATLGRRGVGGVRRAGGEAGRSPVKFATGCAYDAAATNHYNPH